MTATTTTAATDYDEPLPQAVADAAPGQFVVTLDNPGGGMPKHIVWMDQDHIGVIFDESAAGLSRGGFAAWSPRATRRDGTVGFFETLDEAVAAIRALYPVSARDLAARLGVDFGDVLDTAGTLAGEWTTKGHRAVFLSVVTDDADLTAAAADVIAERLADPREWASTASRVGHVHRFTAELRARCNKGIRSRGAARRAGVLVGHDELRSRSEIEASEYAHLYTFCPRCEKA